MSSEGNANTTDHNFIFDPGLFPIISGSDRPPQPLPPLQSPPESMVVEELRHKFQDLESKYDTIASRYDTIFTAHAALLTSFQQVLTENQALRTMGPVVPPPMR